MAHYTEVTPTGERKYSRHSFTGTDFQGRLPISNNRHTVLVVARNSEGNSSEVPGHIIEIPSKREVEGKLTECFLWSHVDSHVSSVARTNHHVFGSSFAIERYPVCCEKSWLCKQFDVFCLCSAHSSSWGIFLRGLVLGLHLSRHGIVTRYKTRYRTSLWSI